MAMRPRCDRMPSAMRMECDRIACQNQNQIQIHLPIQSYNTREAIVPQARDGLGIAD
jgi:hypothetical protein